MFRAFPRADNHARQSVAGGDPGPWLLLLLSPLGAFVPGAAAHAGHAQLTIAVTFGLLALLHGLLMLAWRTGHRRAALLEPLTPLATLLILAVTIATSRTRWPLLWIAVYLYVPILAHLYHRTWMLAVALFLNGAFVLVVEELFHFSTTPVSTMVANALLPPTFYLLLSVDPERERRAHADIARHAEALEKARSEERRLALAREVHDGIGAHLTAAAMQAEVALDTRQDEPVRAQAALARLRARIGQALEELALLTADRPETTWRSLGEELRQSGDGLAPTCLVECELQLAMPDMVVKPAIALTLLRVAQEGLSNAVRHGKARRVVLALQVDATLATLSISDDGVGMMGSAEGFGRRGINARLRSVGGDARWEAGPQGGTVLRLRVPLASLPSQVAA